MRKRLSRIGVATVAGLAASFPCAPAHAGTGAEENASRGAALILGNTGNVGSADFIVRGNRSSISRLARCTVPGTGSASTTGDTDVGVKFGSGSTSCDQLSGAVRVTGSGFEFSALVPDGGPRIKINSFKVACDSRLTGSDTGISLSGFSGFSLPDPIPKDYQQEIGNGRASLAVLHVNEIVPDATGAPRLTLLRIEFLAASGITGTVRVGQVRCGPIL